jgi:regulator of protease activity HflC (stomatin/prohibitin superfamily)
MENLGWLIFIVPLFVVLIRQLIRQIEQYQRGLVFTLGKFSGIKEPG